MKTTLKMLILLIAASIAYSLESFTCDPMVCMTDTSMFKTHEGEAEYLESYNKALKLWEVNYEELDLKTDFGKAHVIISGPERGSPLVLLHGMNASSTMWYPNAKDLSSHYRIYAIDFIEEPGRSVLQKHLRSKEDIVIWYSQIFEQLNLKHFSLIGESRGGWLAVQLALHSHNIDKIVLISPAQTLTWVKPKKKILRNIYYSFFPQRTQLRQTLKTLSYDVDHLAQPWVEQYYTCLKNMKMDTEFLKMEVYSDDELKSLNMPVLLLVGDHDIINSETSLERAKKLIPHVKAEVVDKAGHFVSFDQPEKVDQEILTFLASR